MAYRIEYSREAQADLDLLTKREQVIVRTAVPRYLKDQPDLAAGAREIVRANTLGAAWALHLYLSHAGTHIPAPEGACGFHLGFGLGELRVYYDVVESEKFVWIVRVGRKVGSTLYLRGQPFDLG